VALIRFLLEAVFLILVAIALAAAHLRWYAIVLAMFGAWLVVAFVERTASREPGALRLGRLAGAFSAAPEPEPEGHEAPSEERVREEPARTADVEQAPPPPRRWRLWHRPVEARAEAAAEVVTPSHVKVVPPEPAPEPQAAPAPPAPEPERVEAAPVAVAEAPPPPAAPRPVEPPPAPAAGPRPAPPSAPPPELPEPAAPHAGVVPFPPRADGPQEWNLWDLERLAREREGEDAERDEERTLLLVYLREFANADGLLPTSFDSLVRESFGELLVAGRR
jgi:hypothetical protein